MTPINAKKELEELVDELIESEASDEDILEILENEEVIGNYLHIIENKLIAEGPKFRALRAAIRSANLGDRAKFAAGMTAAGASLGAAAGGMKGAALGAVVGAGSAAPMVAGGLIKTAKNYFNMRKLQKDSTKKGTLANREADVHGLNKLTKAEYEKKYLEEASSCDKKKGKYSAILAKAAARKNKGMSDKKTPNEKKSEKSSIHESENMSDKLYKIAHKATNALEKQGHKVHMVYHSGSADHKISGDEPPAIHIAYTKKDSKTKSNLTIGSRAYNDMIKKTQKESVETIARLMLEDAFEVEKMIMEVKKLTPAQFAKLSKKEKEAYKAQMAGHTKKRVAARKKTKEAIASGKKEPLKTAPKDNQEPKNRNDWILGDKELRAKLMLVHPADRNRASTDIMDGKHGKNGSDFVSGGYKNYRSLPKAY